MKKLKVLITCLLAVGVLATSSLTSLAATKVEFYLYYTNVIYANSVLSRSKSIDGTSKRYYAKCTDSYNKGLMRFHVPGATDYTLDENQSHIFTRSLKTSGKISVKASLVRPPSGAATVEGYIEKK